MGVVPPESTLSRGGVLGVPRVSYSRGSTIRFALVRGMTTTRGGIGADPVIQARCFAGFPRWEYPMTLVPSRPWTTLWRAPPRRDGPCGTSRWLPRWDAPLVGLPRRDQPLAASAEWAPGVRSLVAPPGLGRSTLRPRTRLGWRTLPGGGSGRRLRLGPLTFEPSTRDVRGLLPLLLRETLRWDDPPSLVATPGSRLGSARVRPVPPQGPRPRAITDRGIPRLG